MTRDPARSGDDSDEPFQLACRYLTNRERCRAEVRTYLRRKGYGQEPIERALERLAERKYVDDVRYARLYVQVRSRNAPRSAQFLIKELRRRGIDHETARSAVSEFFREVSEEELARRVLAKLPGEGRQWRERAARRLRARGFRPSLALRDFTESSAAEGYDTDEGGSSPVDETHNED